MNYTVEKGIIYTEKGLPWGPRWFCDSRIAFQTDGQSITEIDYFGPATHGSHIAFLKRFWKGMSFYILHGNTRTALTPDSCEILPFGFTSRCGQCEYSIYAAGNCIYIRFRPYDESSMSMEFYDDFLFFPETRTQRDIRYGGIERSWSLPEFTDQILRLHYCEQDTVTHIAISSNTVLDFHRTKRNTKNILTLKQLSPGREYVLAISFSNTAAGTWEGYDTILDRQFERYQMVAKKSPILKSCRPMLNQFFQLAPLYHESLKTMDVAGAIRAQTTHYWVWGWDSLTSNQCTLYWGDHEFIGQMLECMEKYSDSEAGIAHAFDRNMHVLDTAPPPAQGMYITLLDLYRTAGGDWEKHYLFARTLFRKIASTEVTGLGLCRGTSLYPDFRNLINETGNDISAFNNTVSYCAVRSMERMALSIHDQVTADEAGSLAGRIQSCFERLMFNEDTGFMDSSIDADSLKKRNVPSNNAVKWENNFCEDLIKNHASEYLSFYEKHLVSPAGLRPLPEWNECYDADSNQLHCWWPVMSEFYTRLINRFDRTDLINQYAEWVEYWSKRLTCPEGIPCYDNIKEVPFDSWNCMSGIWHGYSIRGFYNALVHSYVGIDFDENGLNIYPYSGEEAALYNLHFGHRTFDITITGSGKQIGSVVVNGKSLGAVACVAYEKFSIKNTVEIIRK